MMTRRKVRDQSDAAELLEALDASGQSLPDFCMARGLDGRSLNCWRHNLQRDEAPGSRGIRLVELTAARPTAAVYRVVVDRFEVEVDDHFRDDTLARLLAVVAAC
jgi:hypothetical protein